MTKEVLGLHIEAKQLNINENGQSKAFAKRLTYAGQSLRTQIGPCVCRPIPTYPKPQEQTCVYKNRVAYA